MIQRCRRELKSNNFNCDLRGSTHYTVFRILFSHAVFSLWSIFFLPDLKANIFECLKFKEMLEMMDVDRDC
jgi:hypothetical protein